MAATGPCADSVTVPPVLSAGRRQESVPRFSRAAAIAERICEGAVRVKDGSVTWLAPPRPGHGPAALGPHVYDGTTGVALFLGAFHQATGDADAGTLARQAVAPLRRKLRELVADPGRAEQMQLAVGGLVGLGAFLYAFVRLSRFLDDAELLDEAGDLMALLPPERIAQDERFDVMNGSAGALLSLLALEREAPGPDSRGRKAAELAVVCGRHLLKNRVSWNGSPRAWPGPGRPPISGFAHGAAGISYALLRLHELTGERCFETAALEGFAFERSLYRPEARNWLDPRFDRLVEQSAWCHGAPGIALGRAAAPGTRTSSRLREEAEEALATTRNPALTLADHLCCGNMGRVEILVLASRALDRPDLEADARDLASRVLERHDREGDFALDLRQADPVAAARDDELPAPPFMPSLFFGLAGIGFTLLRLAGWRDLPSPLLMD